MNTFSVEVRRSANWGTGGSIGIVRDADGREAYRTKPVLKEFKAANHLQLWRLVARNWWCRRNIMTPSKRWG